MSRLFLPLACIFLLSDPVSANAPPPAAVQRAWLEQRERAGAPTKKIKLERDDSIDVVRIIIPRDMTLAQAHEPTGRGRTIVAGLALTAAFATSGLWLARGRPRGALKLAAALVVSVGVAGCWWWDKEEPKTPVNRLEFAGAGQDARVWLTDEGDEIRILLPKKQADRIKVK